MTDRKSSDGKQASEAAPAASTDDNAALAETSVGTPKRDGGTADAQVWVGRTLGKYQITSVLGQGAMGVVLKSRDPLIERDVAIKVLAEHLATDTAAAGRFLSEAKSAGKLNHPNVMAIYEICQEGSLTYLVLEFVGGGSLEDRLEERNCLPVLEATQAMIDACKGVSAAHAVGLIHRDIKPANFMRAADGSIKVADFGLAKAVGDTGRGFTQTGMVVGTPYFMSPEQCEAKPLDHRCDIYSLGATFYCLLTGSNPYETSESIPQLLYAHCHAPIPDPRALNWALPEACTHIIARAMAKAPADRYQSAAEMLADLQALLATLSGQKNVPLPSGSGAVRGRRSRRNLFLAAGIVLLALAGLFLWRPWQQSQGRGNLGGAPPSGEPILIGVLHSLTGTMATSETPVLDAALFAVDEVNQAGGVLGRPVKAVIGDGRSDEGTFVREAERLITAEKVCTIFGCWTSASRKAVKGIVEEHDHLLVYPLQYEGLETSPCIVYLGAAPNQQILPAVDWAMTSLGKKRFYYVGSDYVFPRAAGAILKDHLQKAGAEWAGEAYVPLGSQKLDGMIQAVSKAKPDMILNAINGDSNIALFRGLRAAGITSAQTPTMSFSIGEQGLSSLNPALLVGDYSAWNYFQAVETPENEEFVRRFQAKYPQHKVTDPMETTYVGVKLWAQAVKEAQSLDPKKIRRALLNQQLKGPGGDVRIEPDTQHCYRTPRIGQIQADGRFKVIWTAAAPVRPEPYPSTRTAEAWRALLHDLYTGWGNRWSAAALD